MSNERYMYDIGKSSKYMTVDECDKLREKCHADVCSNIRNINDKLVVVTEGLENSLKVATDEMIELRKSMSDIVLKIAVLLVGFAATIIASLIAVIVILV